MVYASVYVPTSRKQNETEGLCRQRFGNAKNNVYLKARHYARACLHRLNGGKQMITVAALYHVCRTVKTDISLFSLFYYYYHLFSSIVSTSLVKCKNTYNVPAVLRIGGSCALILIGRYSLRFKI